MEITSNIKTGTDSVDITSRYGGEVAELQFSGKHIYIAKRKGVPNICILIAPDKRWDEVIAYDYEILGKLSEYMDYFDRAIL